METLQKNVIQIIRISTCLIGVFLMAFDKPIMGTDNTGEAIVVGTIGIGLLTTGNKTSFIQNKKEGL